MDVPGAPYELRSIASTAVANRWGMGALHVGIAVLDAIPDGWAKVEGLGWIRVERVRGGGIADIIEHEGVVLLVVDE